VANGALSQEFSWRRGAPESSTQPLLANTAGTLNKAAQDRILVCSIFGIAVRLTQTLLETATMIVGR